MCTFRQLVSFLVLVNYFLFVKSSESEEVSICGSSMDTCEAACLIDDSNPESCKICCDMVYDMCIIDDLKSLKNKNNAAVYKKKFDFCIEKAHNNNGLLFSKNINRQLRKDMSIYPGLNEKYTQPH